MSILVIGNDDRQRRLCELLLPEGYDARAYDGDLLFGETVILPLPLSRDGVTVNTVPELALSEISAASCGRRIFFGKAPADFVKETERVAELCCDYNEIESFLWENARITAEAALALAIDTLPIQIFGMNAVVIGFGRIAKILSKYLKALGAEVTVCARKPSDLGYASAEGYGAYSIADGFSTPLPYKPDAVFNTAPALLIDKEASWLFSGAVAFDLAGGGAMSQYDGEVVMALALPAKYSPLGAAQALFNSIKDKL